MNQQKQMFNASFLALLVIVPVLILMGVGLAFWPVLRIFVDPTYESKPPSSILPLEDKSAVYLITYDRDPTTGLYVIYPVQYASTGTNGSLISDSKHPARISSSPVSLEQYVNKKIKITGSIVWTFSYLRRPNFPNPTGVIKGAAVKIDSIALAQ